FAGTISGGNARGASPAQTFSYGFDVPTGKRDLDVSVTLAKDPGDLLEGVLVDPDGETPSISTNAAPDGSGKQGRSMQNTEADPRTTTTQKVQLAPQFAGSTFDLPLDVAQLSAVPAYLIPPDTHQVALSAASTVPAQVELNSPGGGIDLFGDLQSAKNGSTV